MRENFTDGTPYEPVVGFSRAVRFGDHVFVSGTVGWNEERRVPAEAGMYEQAQLAIRHIERTLDRAGAKLSDVVRTRIFTTDISRWEDIARAHREAFGAIGPASTLVEVTRLASPEMLVEIEADASSEVRKRRREARAHPLDTQPPWWHDSRGLLERRG